MVNLTLDLTFTISYQITIKH